MIINTSASLSLWFHAPESQGLLLSLILRIVMSSYIGIPQLHHKCSKVPE